MNFGILGIIGLLGLGVGGAVTAMDVAEERRMAEEQIQAPAVEVQPLQGVESSD